MPYSAIKVANELIRIGHGDAPQRILTPLQIIKLCYIAHGWSLVYLSEPLLIEPAQAWKLGPVIPSLYHGIKHYGASPVTSELAGDTDPQVLSNDAKSLIASVYKTYGHLSGTQLSNMTHLPNTPWSKIWTGAGQNSIIPNELIQAHYKHLAQTRNAKPN